MLLIEYVGHISFRCLTDGHLGRHLEYFKTLNDARVASVGFIKYNASTTRINKEKHFKIKFQVILLFYRTTLNCLKKFKSVQIILLITQVEWSPFFELYRAANQISMYLDPNLNKGWGWRCETGLSPRVKYLTDRSKTVLLLWIFYVFILSCVCYVFLCVCLYVLCGHLLGKGRPLGSHLWCLTMSLSLSHCYRGSGVVLDCIDS